MERQAPDPNTSVDFMEDMGAALKQIRDENKNNLQKKQQDKGGIMFEIRLDEEETKSTREEKTEEMKSKEEEEVDHLNRALSFQEGEELKLKDWSKERKRWSQRTPQTLLDALANMDIHSVYNTAADPEEGRRQWTRGPANSLLNALAHTDLSSTLDSVSTGSDAVDEEVEKEDSDVEMDKERLEPRSDDDDTNFEESEDELREAVADSMRNLYVMESSSSDENEEEKLEEAGDTERENGGAVRSTDQQQVSPEVRENKDSAGSEKDVSTQPEGDPDGSSESQPVRNKPPAT